MSHSHRHTPMTHSRRSGFTMVEVMVALVLLIASVAAACPTCSEGLAQNDPHGQSLAAGYYYSILLMMSTPYLVLATFGSVAYYSIRRARRQQSEVEPSDLA